MVDQQQVEDAVEQHEDNRDRIRFGSNDAIDDGSLLNGDPNEYEDDSWTKPLEIPSSTMPLLARRVEVDKIRTRLGQGIVTRSQLMNFCAHFSFVSSIEPLKEY